MSVVYLLLAVGSLSARRAWIEIIRRMPLIRFCPVALRKESVDRNYRCRCARYSRYWSLSARRAWIEIPNQQALKQHQAVALRKESVDRNNPYQYIVSCNYVALRKESVDRNHDDMLRYRDAEQSLSARRAWIEIKPGHHVGRHIKSRSPQGERG